MMSTCFPKCTDVSTSAFARHRGCVRRTASTAHAGSVMDQHNPKRLADSPILGLKTYLHFESKYVDARRVDVWIPPCYSRGTKSHYPVLYMHDGQNLFDPKTSFLGVDWGVDETMVRLIHGGVIPPTIVVGIWNNGDKRTKEYLPKQPYVDLMPERTDIYKSLKSDDYLCMLVEELKPFIDSEYRTLSDQEHTAIMGSSMGGLISLYALQQYPKVFGSAGCMSVHWPANHDVYLPWLKTHVPSPEDHVLYFDHGTHGLDAEYGDFQRQVHDILYPAGYETGRNILSLVFPGDTHNEVAWRLRLRYPFEFLLGRLKVEGEDAGLCKTR